MLVSVLAAAVVIMGILLFMNRQSEPDTENARQQEETAPKVKQEDQKPQNEDLALIAGSSDAVDKKVSKLLSEMTLEEKVGQLFMVGFQTKEVDTSISDLIENKHIGNVILFDRNMETPDQVRRLNAALQEKAKKANGLPLLIGIDQEGGDIVRMRKSVTPIPSQQELGKGSAEQVKTTAMRTAKELKHIGFNTNFAPVLDLSVTDTRSFGKDPKKAEQFGSAVIDGFSENGITGALKHFPGNGRSQIDPHEETSSVQATQEELEQTDAYPFKKMIETKNNDSFFVMVTHIKYPAYDKEKPASISPIIIQDVLRDRFGFKGIVVTDDLEMGAVNKYYSYKDLGVDAVNAGADLLLVCHEYEHQLEAYEGVLEAAKSGKIKPERIDEAVSRILTHKLNLDDK